jgi:hypothetical protein
MLVTREIYPAWRSVWVWLSIEAVRVPPPVVFSWVRSPNFVHMAVSEDGRSERENEKGDAHGDSHGFER